MTLMIALPPDEEQKLAARAAASGQDVSSYVRQLIERDILQPSFAELFAPLHHAVRDAGIAPAELDTLIQSAIADSRQERRASKPS